jgi:hypothetical protein
MTKRQGTEVPGNVLGTAAQEQRQAARAYAALLTLQSHMEGLSPTGRIIDGIRITDRAGDGTDLLAAVKGVSENGYEVAFSSATNLLELVHSISARLKNGSMKWKEDEYRND